MSYASRKLFTGKHCYIKIASATAGLDSADIIKLSSLKLRFGKNLIDAPMYNTLSAEAIWNQAIEISGSFELQYESRVFHDYVKDGDTKAMRIRFKSNELIGRTSMPQFTLDLSNVVFDMWDPRKPNDNITSQIINFKALYDDTNENIVNNCQLINEISSY